MSEFLSKEVTKPLIERLRREVKTEICRRFELQFGVATINAPNKIQ